MKLTESRAPIGLYWWKPFGTAKSTYYELSSSTSRQSWTHLAFASHRGPYNFGDELSRIAVEGICQRPVRWAPPHKADLFAVGSIAELIPPGYHGLVWGTGARSGKLTLSQDLVDSTRILALRGANTAKQVSLQGPVTLGDPGLVAGELLGSLLHHERRSGKIAILHFRHWANRYSQFRDRLTSFGFRIVPVNLPSIEIARAVVSSDIVFSSSLHGIVLSHILGTAVVQLPLPLGEPQFKFDDYASIFDCSIPTLGSALLDQHRCKIVADQSRELTESFRCQAASVSASLADCLREAI